MQPRWLFFLIVFAFLLVACTPRDGTGSAQPDFPPATPADSVATPLSASATPPALATPTLPASVSLGVGTVTPILAVEQGVLNVQEGPTPEWISYQIRRQDPNIIGPGPRPSPFYVANVTTGKSWIVTSDCNDFFCDVQWTPDGHLLWKEQGAVFMSDAAGTTKTDLEAPERIIEILGISPGGIAIVQGESRLYRLSLTDGVWDAVPEPQPAPAPVVDYVTFNDRLGFTADGQAASVSYETTVGYPYNDTVLLHVPLAFGTAPTVVAIPTQLDYPGSDGPPPIPPIPLANSPYWIPSQTAYIKEGNAQIFDALFIDGRDGSLVSQSDVLGVNTRVLFTSVSPDRRWIAASLETPMPTNGEIPVERYYLAPTNNLSAGVIVTGSHSGWQTNPAAAFFVRNTAGNTVYLRAALPDGNVTALHETLPPNIYPDALATEAALFVVLDHALGTVEVRTPTGAVVATAEIPLYRYVFENGQEDYTDLLAAKDTRAYFLGGGVNNLTQAVIYRWDAAE